MFGNHRQDWYARQLEENISALKDGDRSRIARIFCVFSEQHAASRQRAAQVLAHELERFGFDEIVRVDEQMRQTTSMEWNIDWRQLKIEDFFTPEMSCAERRAVIIFASFNPNGFIREQAVRLMKDYESTMPYILLRRNDWVAQVRQAASDSFAERLQKLNEGELIAALPYAEKLKRSGRGSHGEYTGLFFEKLTSAEHEADLIKGLQSGNTKTRKICINALFGSSQADAGPALKHLEREPDPFLRSILFRKLCLQQTQMDTTARALLRDRFSVNRILALHYLHDAKTEDIRDILTASLLDRNASVRASARELLRKDDGSFDFRSFYLAALESAPAPAIAGLGETGRREDAQRIESCMDDSRAVIVRAALVSLMRLDADQYKRIVLERLEDGRPGVVRTAQQLILKYDVRDYDSIREIFWNTPHEYTKIKCAAILFLAPKWNCLIYMLEALACDTESVQRLALQAISKWLFRFNRSYVQVGERQKESIRLLLDNLDDRLSDSMKKALLFALR